MKLSDDEVDDLYTGCRATLSVGRGYWDGRDCKVRVLALAGDIALAVDVMDVDSARPPCLFVVSRYRLTREDA